MIRDGQRICREKKVTAGRQSESLRWMYYVLREHYTRFQSGLDQDCGTYDRKARRQMRSLWRLIVITKNPLAFPLFRSNLPYL
jgi:hypothetical protein